MNPFNIKRKLFFSVLVSIGLAYSVTVLAYIRDDPFIVGLYFVYGISWSVFLFIYQSKLQATGNNSRREKKENRVFSRRTEIIISRVLGVLIVLTSCTIMVGGLLIDASIYRILRGFVMLPIGIVHLLYAEDVYNETRIFPDWQWLVKLVQKSKGKAVKIHDENESYIFKGIGIDSNYIHKILSCTTCKFNSTDDIEEEEPWCKAPSPPLIEGKYCNTFELKTE